MKTRRQGKEKDSVIEARSIIADKGYNCQHSFIKIKLSYLV
jgi:hypothetical protein